MKTRKDLKIENGQYTPVRNCSFELFSGRTHVFEREINFDTEREFIRKLNAYQEEMYKEVKDRLERQKQERTRKLNEGRKEPMELEKGDVVHRKENRRNKLTPRFTEHTVDEYNGVTLVTKRYINKKLKKGLNKIKTNQSRLQVHIGPWTDNGRANAKTRRSDHKNGAGEGKSNGRSEDVRPYNKL